jgi:hypothetical protein
MRIKSQTFISKDGSLTAAETIGPPTYFVPALSEVEARSKARTSQSKVRHPCDRRDSPVAFVEEGATIHGLARLGKAQRLSDLVIVDSPPRAQLPLLPRFL